MQNKASNMFSECQLLYITYNCSHWSCDVVRYWCLLHVISLCSQTPALTSVIFHPSSTTAVVCSLCLCSHAQMYTCLHPNWNPSHHSLIPLPTTEYQCGKWVSSCEEKANQRNLLPVQNEIWPLDWGARNVSRPTKRQQIKTPCESGLGRGGGLAQIME